MKKQELLENARLTQPTAGVYLMKDTKGGILYVGKAKSLKNRLTQYFQPAVHESPRVQMLIERVDHFEVLFTQTEMEAFVLEDTLIKKYKPPFNIRLKDDKSYPYLKIQLSNPFPQIEWTRKVLSDGARYFGPFPSAGVARIVMQLLHETFLLRDCSENTFLHRSQPCILYQIQRCSAPCVNFISQKKYRKSIQEAIQVLEGKTQTLLQSLHHQMQASALREDYEQAAFYRDRIQSLKLATQTQSVVEAGSLKNRDVLGIASEGHEAHGTLLKIRGGKWVSIQHYRIHNVDPTLSLADQVSAFLSQYYANLLHQQGQQQEKKVRQKIGLQESTTIHDLPEEILVPVRPSDPEWFETILNIPFRAPLSPPSLDIGLNLKPSKSDQARTREADPSGLPLSATDEQLLRVAQTNALYALEKKEFLPKTQPAHALSEIQALLHLSKIPKRIECFDISTLQGQDSVASRVVFIDGIPEKKLYRKYRMRTVGDQSKDIQNDFAMMREVLHRRFSHSDETLPDLVVVDGGKGQLSEAVAVLDALSLSEVSVVGLAKARVQRDFQAKEVIRSNERIFLPQQLDPIPLLPHTEAYRILTHLRDEAHRFAISYHRLLRSKRHLPGPRSTGSIDKNNSSS